MPPPKVLAPPRPSDPIDRLVIVLEDDIRRRGLRPGDKYLTTQEVAGMLGVSTRLANDAMNVLATRSVLIRRPKAGTTIGPDAPHESPALLDVVHLLIRQDYFFSERPRLEKMVNGLTSVLDGTSVQFSFVPAYNELVFVERMVRAAEAGQMRAGYLIAVKSPQVQDFFQRQRVPVVLLGMPYSGINRLCWQDKDQRQIGALVAREVISAGRRHIAVVLRDRRGVGDDLMMDAITHEVLAAKLGSGALTVRSVPSEESLTEIAVREVLSRTDRPTAVICRSRLIFDVVVRVARELRLNIPADLLLALTDPAGKDESPVDVPCVRPIVDSDARSEGITVANMLSELAVGRTPTPDHVLIPVTMPGRADPRVSGRI